MLPFTFLAVLVSSFQFVSSFALRQHNGSFLPDYVLRVTYGPASIACRSKDFALVNGTSPGPEIRLQENITTWIRVYNDMEDSNLTMHWHGLSQSVAPFSDGTPQASQWPIKAKHFFDYEVRPDIGFAGTYFYHSHVGFQAVSAAGPLIVEEATGAQPPYEYEEERLIFLSELYNKTDADVVSGLTSANLSWSGEAETILVNGQSYQALDANETTTLPESSWTKPLTNESQTCGPAIIDVVPGTTYRMRTIGGMALSLALYQFESHDNLTVIAADGSYTKPAQTDHIQIGPGQRFDYILTTKTQEELNVLGKTMFWIQIQSSYRPTDETFYAILRYNCFLQTSNNSTIPTEPPATKPLSISADVQDWLEYTLQPIEPNGFPTNDEVTRRVYLTSAQLLQGNAGWWAVSNRTWTESSEHLNSTLYNSTTVSVGTPYLIDIYRRGEAAIPDYDLAVNSYGGWDPNLNVYVAKPGEVIDIILLNQPDGNTGGYDFHPWHIHGGHIYDIGSGPGNYSVEENYARLGSMMPAKRDTTYLYKYTTDDGVGTLAPYSNQGWRAWRLKVHDYDSGVWMVHCHILQHMIMGMQTVWVMGNASNIVADAEPYVSGYLDFGGSAYGNASYDPLVYHHFDRD